MAKNSQHVQVYFNSHKDVNEFHFTSDGQAFFKPSDAMAHNKNLEDRTVTVVTRAEAFAGEPAEADDANTIEVPVTEELMAANPALAEGGWKAGDIILVPKDDTQSTPAEIAEDVKTALSNKTARKPKPKTKTKGKGK